MPTTPAHDLRLAIGRMAIATLFFFLMSVAVKAASGLPTLQIVFFRAAIALVLCLGQLAWLGISPRGTVHRLLLARGALGTAALCCYFWSLGHLPLATAAVLQNLAPLFTTALAALALKQRPGSLALLGLAFGGVWLVEGADPSSSWVGIGVAVTGAALSAGAYACIAAIGQREHPLVIMLWFPLLTVPLVGPVLPWIWVWPTAWEWAALGAVGLSVQVAQYFMTSAYQGGPAGPVSLVSYLGVVWAALGGWLLFDEPMSAQGALGMALILGAVLATRRAG